MPTLLLTCLFCLIAALLVWLFSRLNSERTLEFRSLATRLSLRYSSRLSFSHELRLRQFSLLSASASSSARHCLTSTDDQLQLMDITALTRKQLAEQTVILIHCPLRVQGRLCISQKRWLEHDQLTARYGQPLQQLESRDLPQRLCHWYCLSDTRHRLRSWFRDSVIDWLLAHPGLHVEWSDDWLLVCQPGYRLMSDEVEQAINDVQRLAGLLQSSPTERGEHHEQAE